MPLKFRKGWLFTAFLFISNLYSFLETDTYIRRGREFFPVEPTNFSFLVVSVSAVKQGLVGRNMHIVRDEKTTETSTRDGNGDIVERARATVSMRSPRD